MIKMPYDMDESQNCPRMKHSWQPNIPVIRAEPRTKEAQNVTIATKQAIISATVGLEVEAKRVSHQDLERGKEANPKRNLQMLWMTKL